MSVRTKKPKNSNSLGNNISSPEINLKPKKKNIKKKLSKSSSINSKFLPKKNFPVSNNTSIEFPQAFHSHDNSYENNFNQGNIFKMNNFDPNNFQPSKDNSFLGRQLKNNSAKCGNKKSQINSQLHNTYDSLSYLNYGDSSYRYMNLLKSRDNSNRAIMQMESFELIKLLLKQYEMFLQILIQNVLLTPDNSLKYRCYSMLFSLYMARRRILNTVKLPEHEVYFNFCRIFNENKGIKLRPQISFFQSPILEITPILVKFIMKKTFYKEEVTQILKEFLPFVNPVYLPITNKGIFNKSFSIKENVLEGNYEKEYNVKRSEDEFLNDNKVETLDEAKLKNSKENSLKNSPENDHDIKEDSNSSNEENNIASKNSYSYMNTFLNKKRRKFDNIHDHLLMIGLLTHGKKNIETVQQLWLESKTSQEIRHRIKNLTCFKAPDNIIKKWKTMNDSILSKHEFFLFLKGIQWFGFKKKWNAISRYFLPERSAEYLEEYI